MSFRRQLINLMDHEFARVNTKKEEWDPEVVAEKIMAKLAAHLGISIQFIPSCEKEDLENGGNQ